MEPTTVWATFKRGFQLSPELRAGLVVTLALAVVAATGRTAVPFVTQRVTDLGLLAPGGVNVGVAVTYAGAGAVLLIIAAAVDRLVRMRMVRAAESGLATLRVRAFNKVHELSVLTQNADQRGRYVSRVTGDVETMRDLMQWTGAAMVVAGLETFIVFIVMAVYSWQLALVVAVAYIPTVIALTFIQPRIRDAFRRAREFSADLLGATGEQLVGVSTIRAYGVQKRMRTTLREHNAKIVAADARAGWLATSTFATNSAGQSVATGLTLIAGTYLALQGQLSVGTVVAFAFLVYQFAGPLSWIIEMLAEMQRAMVGWRRVIGLVDSEVTVPDPGPHGTEIPRGRGELVIDGVRMTYPSGPEVLKGIDLTVASGQRLALVGQTGSGKTTLARILCRFVDPTQGAVSVGGVDLREVPQEQLRRAVAIVPQEGFLFDGTIRSNLQYAVPEAPADELESRAMAAFESLGLEGWIEHQPQGLDTPVGPRGELLSAGERQLVAIARVYLRDPDLLILDEATSAVDPATEVRISRALEGLMAGRTSIVIAHRLSTAERADVVAVMDAGRLVEVGPHADLVERGGTYAGMHEAWVAQTR